MMKEHGLGASEAWT